MARQRINVEWDDRLNALTDEMLRCRARRRHKWEPAGCTDIVTSRRTGFVLNYRQHWRCDEGCLTTMYEDLEVLGRAVKRVGHPHMSWDERYKIVGEIDQNLLSQQKYVDAAPHLFEHLQRPSPNGRGASES